MPKPNLVFRAAFDDEEDESEEDIVVIPYTKPPPVVIDLLESDSGNDSGNESGRKSGKKKSKKKKGKRDKERENSGSANVANLGDLSLNESSVSSHIIDLESQDSLPDDSNECVEVTSGGQVVELRTSSEDGSENVAAESSNILSTGGSSSETHSKSTTPVQHSLLEKGASGTGSSSHFEKCLDGQSTEVDNGKRSETGMEMDGTTPTHGNDKQKRVKSKERKTKGEGKSRTRTLSATQRTNEEIVNFLTTLGIQMDPNAFETPVTRKRQSRKRPTQAPVPAESEGNSRDSSVSTTNSCDGQNFPVPLTDLTPSGAYVSVTQDINNASNATPKGRRQRQAISGDLSDYTISFTNKDLNAINTSFQTNVLMGENDNSLENVEDSFISVSNSSEKSKPKTPSAGTMKPNYYSEIIDAVARGLDSSRASSHSLMEAENSSAVSLDNNEAFSQNPKTQQARNPEITEMEIDSAPDESGNNGQANAGVSKEISQNESTQSQSQNNVEKISQLSAQTDASDAATAVHQVSMNNQEKSGNQNQKVTAGGTPVATGDKTIQHSVIIDIEEEASSSSDGTSSPQCTNDLSKSSLGGDAPYKSVNNKRNSEGNNKRKFSEIDTPRKSLKKNSEADAQSKENGNRNVAHRRSPERKRHKSSNSSTTVTAAKASDIQKTDDKIKAAQANNCTSNILAPTPQMSANMTPCHVPKASYYPTTWSDHMRDFYGSSRDEEFELEDVWASLPDSSNLWKAYKDMMPPPKNKRRHVRCDRCKQLGHLIKECKEKWKPPTCHYCGKTGHTSDNHSRHSRTCPSALCLNCGRSSSRYAQKCHKCLLQSRPNRCDTCNVSGHDKSICPDNWRRYHSTTSPDDFEKTEELLKIGWKDAESSQKSGSKDTNLYKRSSKLYCANCGRRGHSFYDCNSSKFNPYPRNKPFVIFEVRTNESTHSTALPHSQSSSSAACIPISFDSRTGRAVVMNAESEDQPEIAVETIQVKITNELALRNDKHEPIIETSVPPMTGGVSFGISAVNTVAQSGNVFDRLDLEIAPKNAHGFACENKRCRNRLRNDERCYQMLMNTEAHANLMDSQQRGILKALEEKHNVQIYVLNDGYKVHISGSNVLEADKDLHNRLRTGLWHETQGNKNLSQKNINIKRRNMSSCSTGERNTSKESTAPSPSTTRSVQMINVSDEEDECSIIVEIAADSAANSKEPPAQKGTLKNKADTPRSSKSFFMDQSPSGVTVEPESTKAEETKNETRAEQTTHSTSSKSSWLEYESPLAGLSLSTDVFSTNDNAKESQIQPESNLPGSSVSAKNEGKEATTMDTQDDSSSELFEFEEIDYSTINIQRNANQPNSEDKDESMDAETSDSDLEVIEPPPPTVENNVEIIIIDDDDDEPLQREQSPEETVTLLPSEWELAMAELVKKNNTIKQISEEFKVEIMVSKESSSIVITKGTEQNLKLAKDEIVFWLECKCLKTDYHFVRRLADSQLVETPAGPSNPKRKRKRPNKSKQRVLQLNDVQQHDTSGQLKAIKKRKRKPKRQFQFNRSVHNNSNSTAETSSSGSSSFSSDTSSPATFGSNKRNFKKSSSSSPFNSKGPLHTPSPKKMQQRNSSNDNNNGAGFWVANSKTFKPQPRKQRYFQT